MQIKAMVDYIAVLEARAVMEGVGKLTFLGTIFKGEL